MKTEVFTNRLRYIRAELNNRLMNCTSFNIATAFVDSETIDLIEDALLRNKSLKDAKILVGTYGYFNKKADIERLQKIASTYSVIVQIRISRSKAFHLRKYSDY